MAFGDADGTIHLMSQAESNVPFNGFDGQPVPWADTPAPLPPIQWSSSTCDTTFCIQLTLTSLKTFKFNWTTLLRQRALVGLAILSKFQAHQSFHPAENSSRNTGIYENQRQPNVCCLP